MWYCGVAFPVLFPGKISNLQNTVVDKESLRESLS